MSDQSIPFADLKAQYLELKPEIDAAMARVIGAAAFINGPAVAEFEAALAKYHGVPHAVGLNSCTAALAGVLKRFVKSPADEVICPAHTYAATAESIILAGARPVFADIDPATYQIDPGDAARQITPHTRAIVAVHIYGTAAPMDDLTRIANMSGLPLIEDCAQAQGMRLGGRLAGTMGAAGCFSFFPSKNLGAFGDAGAVVTRDAGLAAFVRMWANHGRTEKFQHEFPAANERLDTLQAAILNVKMTKLDEWNARKTQAAAWYAEELAPIAGLALPQAIDGCQPAWHLYVIRVRDTVTREALRAHLKWGGIQTGLHYPSSLPEQPAFAPYAGERCPVAGDVCQTILSLPLFPHITREQVARVGEAMREFFAR